MKKFHITRLAALLLAVLLCLTVVVPSLAAEEEPALDGAAAHTHDGITFTNNMLLLTSFYLTKDLDLPMDITVPEGKTVDICLNGFTLTPGGHKLVVQGVVNLYDCQGGGVLDVTNGSLTIDGGTFNVYGGTVVPADALGTEPAETPAPSGEPTGEPEPTDEPEPTAEPEPLALVFNEAGTQATVSGDYEGLYVRVALVIDNSGQTGLYVTQVPINPDRRIMVPEFKVPGLTVVAVNVALVPTLEDIQSPTPDVSISAVKRLG